MVSFVVQKLLSLIKSHLVIFIFISISLECFLSSVSQGNRNKSKNRQIGSNQMYKHLHSEGNHKQNEKITYGLRETYLQMMRLARA